MLAGAGEGGARPVSLEFTVLGPVGCRRDGEPVPVGGPQQRRLLAALLADAGRVVLLDRLVEAIWADAAPDGARRTAMTYVSRLRAALGDGLVESVDPGYRLSLGDDATLDAASFERLVARSRTVPPSQALSILDEALGLWQGSAYGEFATEWWALPEATRLEELRLVAIEERIEALLSIGDAARAISELEGLVSTYPLRERLVGQLMKAHQAAGRQAEALRALQAHRDFLAEETGLEPSPGLIELEQSILGGGDHGPVGTARSLRGYVLGDVLGEGAFGTVYRSVQPGIDREVAVKVIRAELASDPSFVRRFEAEAQLVAHLEHPHIVPLYDFWREPGGAYLVFRLLRGGSAEDALASDGRLDLDRVTRLVTEVGSALVAAHQAGVVHRDVKPSNILFDDIGNSYLVDFGIASDDRVADLTPASAGSPLYAPPEQFHPHHPDPLTDQYSLAAVAYELLCGDPPFAGDSVSTILQKKLEQPVPRLADRRSGLPSGLDAVLQRATASDPAERYPSMSEMLAAWQRAARPGISTDEVEDDGAPGVHRDAALPAGVVATMASLASASNPYVGLRAFAEADVRNFRGRSDLADALTEALVETRFMAVVGPSGSGKSSVIHAGLVPRLRTAGDRIVSMVPGDDPLAQLRLALLTVAMREPHRDEPAEVVRAVASEATTPLTLVVDQLEELWTLSPEDDRRVFLTALAALASSPPKEATTVRVVVGVRADFYDRPLAEPELGPLVGANTFPVTPMTAAELHEAITAPAASVGVSFEPGLDSQIVADVVDQPASLPLLQFTLAELYARRNGAIITKAAYRDLGGIAGAIGSRAESLYASLSPQNATHARLLMLRLVVPGDGTEDTRRRVRLSELPPGASTVAERFESGRLLVGDHDPNTREPTIEVAHESLLRSWPRLQGWLQEDRDALRAVQHLSGATRAWEDADRSDAELYRGARLEIASSVLESRPEQLTHAEREFVETSARRAADQVERDRRSRTRLRRLLTATAAALVIALLAGAVAFLQRREAQDNADAADHAAGEADVSRLVSLSQSLAVSKRDVAALLALEASRRDPSPTTDGALMTALYSDPSFVGDVRLAEDSAGEVEFSSDGETLWTNPRLDGMQAARTDVATREVSPIRFGLQGENGISELQPIDERLVAVTFDAADPETFDRIGHTVYVVDVTDDQTIAEADLGDPYVSDMRVSPDGTQLAITTMVWDSPATPEVEPPGVSQVIVLSLPELERVGSIDQPGPPVEFSAPTSTWVADDLLATGSEGGRMLLWRPSTGEVVRRINDPPVPDWVLGHRVVATRDGTTLVAAAGPEGHMMAFDVATGAPRWPRAVVANPTFVIDEVRGVVFAQETGFGSSRLVGIDLETGERTGARLDGQHGTACDVAITPDSGLLALASCNEGAVALWSLDGDSPTGASFGPLFEATNTNQWSPDGRRLLVFDAANRAMIRELGSGRDSPVDVEDPEGPWYFQSDGELVHLANHPFDAELSDEIEVFDVTGARTRSFAVDLPDSITGGLAWNERTSMLAFGDEESEEVTFVDMDAGEVVRSVDLGVGAAHGLAFSPDGDRLYAAGQNEVLKVLEMPAARTLHEVDGFANVTLSPDGRLVAANAFNGLIRFFDADTLRPVGGDLSGATAFTNVMQFTSDGRFLLTSGLDNTLRIWDVASRRQIGPDIALDFIGEALSPDGKQVAIHTKTGIQPISLDRNALREAACRSAARELTEDEWRRYVGGPERDLCPDPEP